MDLVQLEIFKAVAEQGSISAAAQHIHRVPSNLTTRIKQLEEDLGVELFIREKSRLRLSPAGWNFLEYTRRILDLVHEARLTVAGEDPQAPSRLVRWKARQRCAFRLCWRHTTSATPRSTWTCPPGLRGPCSKACCLAAWWRLSSTARCCTRHWKHTGVRGRDDGHCTAQPRARHPRPGCER